MLKVTTAHIPIDSKEAMEELSDILVKNPTYAIVEEEEEDFILVDEFKLVLLRDLVNKGIISTGEYDDLISESIDQIKFFLN
jgi:hypothetical protein